MVINLKHVFVLCVVIAACRFNDNDIGDRACTIDDDCRPDQACLAGLCTQKNCTAPETCGTNNTFQCMDGKCVADICMVDANCRSSNWFTASLL